MVTDPVCGMKIEPEMAHSRLEYEGVTLYFCSSNCEEEFKRNPEKYLSKIKREMPTKHAEREKPLS